MQLVLALFGTLSFQKGPLWWAQTHRMHHMHADTERDLHSPTLRGFFYAHFVWFQERKNQATDYSYIRDFGKYPELRVLNDWRVYFSINLLAVAALYHFLGLEQAIWGGACSTIVCYQLAHSIQSVSHWRGGYRRCPSDDESRNHVAIGLLTLGEWHNNHHYLPSSARQGFAWWEIDVQFWVLKALAWLGLIWDLRVPAEASQESESRPARATVTVAARPTGESFER
jgi:stearoyl-CoA desaturase (delta-9 desaturase)